MITAVSGVMQFTRSPSFTSGCAIARLAAPRATAAMSTGDRRATRTRAKSRNSVRSRDSRSDSRTMSAPRVRASSSSVLDVRFVGGVVYPWSAARPF